MKPISPQGERQEGRCRFQGGEAKQGDGKDSQKIGNLCHAGVNGDMQSRCLSNVATLYKEFLRNQETFARIEVKQNW